MRKLLLPLLALAALALPARAQGTLPRPDANIAEFARGVKLTVAGYNGAPEVQTNFPVLVRLSTTITGFDYNDFYNKSATDLSQIDIGFVDAEGNGLSYDVDTWNPSGESLVWVNLPRMTNGTEFAMWYRSSKTGKDLNPDNVWTNYAGVWHFREDYGTETGSVKVYDSTTNQLTGSTLYNTTTKGTSVSGGKVGRGRRMGDNIADANKGTGGIDVSLDEQNSPKRAAVDRLASPTPVFSTSFWIYPEMTVRYPYYISRKNADTYPAWAIQSNDNKANTANAFRIFSCGDASNKNLGIGNVGAAQNTWTKIDVVYTDEGSTGKGYFYVNGVLKNNGGNDLNSGKAANGSVDLYIGGGSGNDCRPFGGIMDEVRLQYGRPTAARIKADFDTVNTAGFLTASTVVTNQIVERPVVNFTVVDIGASHIQFGGNLSSLGSDQATECTFYAKVWPAADAEPPTWTSLGTGLGVGSLSGLVKGLTPRTAYSYRLKVTNNEGDEGVDSYETADDFMTSGVGVSGTGGDVTRVDDDWIHYFRVGTDDESGDTVNTYTFTPPSYANTVRALVVAGGGPGGYKAGGGGGAGGLIYSNALAVTVGNTYTITVGEGGSASTSITEFGKQGGSSSISNGVTEIVRAIGGGAGGNLHDNNATWRIGQGGGSGGGSPHSGSAAGAGTIGQGNAGGKGNGDGLAGGGGGAFGEGGSALDSGDFRNAGSGGGGFECDISGIATFYAGGGGGGGKQVPTKPGTAGVGGNGGGGTGSRMDVNGTASAATAGVDGLGGGGGGGCGDEETLYKGGDGGDGIVIIRYASQGDYTEVTEPIISLQSAICNDATFQGDVTFRVAWAGYGCETADVKIAWGYSRNNLIHETDVIATGVVGRASGSFDLIADECTVYCRAIAINGKAISSESTETQSFYVNDNPKGRVDDSSPILANVDIARVEASYAVVTGIVVSTGVSSDDPKACTVRVKLGSNANNLSPATGASGSFPLGAFSLNIANLAPGTTYYYCVEAEDDNGTTVDTDPESFTTLQTGNPSGYFGPDQNDPAVEAASTSLSASVHVTSIGDGAISAEVYIQASTTSDFAAIAATSESTTVNANGVNVPLVVDGLAPETAYHLRYCIANNGGKENSAVIGPYTTAAAIANLTIPAVPASLSLVSVTTNGVEVAGDAGIYPVANGAIVVVTFTAAEGFRLVDPAAVSVAVNGNTTFTDFPEAISDRPVSLSFPGLPANVTVVSVTTNGVAVAPVEGVYTVLDGASVTVTFAAAEGYVLSGAPGEATITVMGDTAFPSTSIPAAIETKNAIKINEIMASNPSVDKGGITSALGLAEMDWVEIYNGASEPVDIKGWHITDKPKKPKKAQIFGSCVIPAGGYKIVWLDKVHTNDWEYAPGEAYTAGINGEKGIGLSSGGDFIRLTDGSGKTVDEVDFSTKPQIKGYSYGPLAVLSGGNLVPGNGDPVYMKTATPSAPNVTEGWGDFTPAVSFSEPHGYKTEAFNLELVCSNAPTAAIYYTLDGSSPTTASILYTNAIPVSRTTVVRAAVPDPAAVLQFDTSATYVFLDDVLAEPRSGTAPASAVGFPNDNAVNGQEMLYGMEQSIVTGADHDRLLRGFTNSIPTLSVVVDPANLFNVTTGIYVNAQGDGVEWERAILLEGFDPTGVGADFSQPAGIRIRGGWSRRNLKPKHSLRFFFRSSYGASSLAEKMFPGELPKEAGEYDKLDLRTSQNNSWANEDSNKDTFVTEVFSRDSQRDLGQPYTRSRYYNLFINGQYWGLYQTQERGDEHWAESYLGGDSLQYDLIKTASSYSGNNITYSIECNEGTWDAWSNLWEIATTEGFGPGHEENYNKILGLNPNGTRNPAYPILLNAESLMAYMLVSHYVVDRDGPTSPFSSGDKGHPNNFYALRNRDDAGDINGFVFLRHDGEMSMGQGDHTSAGSNPTYWGTEECTEFSGAVKHRTIPYFTPAELHYLLMQNPAYKRAYADLFYRECLREGGALTVENATARYASRMAEIDDAIVCEAARWGRGKYNRSTWLNACKTSTNFIKDRLTSMKSQYVSAHWYPAVDPPAATNALGVALVDGDKLDPGEKFYFAGIEAGTVYYTTNGIDPRAGDDSIAAGAIAYDPAAGAELPPLGAVVKARVLASGADPEWSALYEVELDVNLPSDQQLYVRIAEIMSVPTDDPAGEFITLTNLNAGAAISLRGLVVKAEKSTKTATELFTIADDISLPAGGTLRLDRADYWPGDDKKLKNNDIVVELRDSNDKPVQTAIVDAATWFGGVCKGTGRYFIALEHLGYTDDADVTEESQWIPSPAETTKKTTILVY